MSEYIELIKKQYGVDFKGALEIMEWQDQIRSWFFNQYHPYGKYRH